MKPLIVFLVVIAVGFLVAWGFTTATAEAGEVCVVAGCHKVVCSTHDCPTQKCPVQKGHHHHQKPDPCQKPTQKCCLPPGHPPVPCCGLCGGACVVYHGPLMNIHACGSCKAKVRVRRGIFGRRIARVVVR